MNTANDALLMSSRAEQRRAKLIEAEREQLAEEMEALKITEEQLNILKLPFRNVKFEFWDLDGMHWTQSSLYTRQYTPTSVAWHESRNTSYTSPSVPSPVSSSRGSVAPAYTNAPLPPPPPHIIDLTEPSPSPSSSPTPTPTPSPISSPSAPHHDPEATIRLPTSSRPLRTRKTLTRVYSSRDLRLDNSVPVPGTPESRSESKPASNSTKAGATPTAVVVTTKVEYTSENAPAPPAHGQQRPILRMASRPSLTSSGSSHGVSAGGSLGRSHKPKRLSSLGSSASDRPKESTTNASVGRGGTAASAKEREVAGSEVLGVKEPGSPMRELDFNTGFNRGFSAADFGGGVSTSMCSLASELKACGVAVPSYSATSPSVNSNSNTGLGWDDREDGSENEFEFDCDRTPCPTPSATKTQFGYAYVDPFEASLMSCEDFEEPSVDITESVNRSGCTESRSPSLTLKKGGPCERGREDQRTSTKRPYEAETGYFALSDQDLIESLSDSRLGGADVKEIPSATKRKRPHASPSQLEEPPHFDSRYTDSGMDIQGGRGGVVGVGGPANATLNLMDLYTSMFGGPPGSRFSSSYCPSSASQNARELMGTYECPPTPAPVQGAYVGDWVPVGEVGC